MAGKVYFKFVKIKGTCILSVSEDFNKLKKSDQDLMARELISLAISLKKVL